MRTKGLFNSVQIFKKYFNNIVEVGNNIQLIWLQNAI